ncbi:hypothetical protein BGZ70_008757 [Mortierella alpina]|uniref:Uncharacterized protein n=1 Tax=Mortierella alpina TaxID=64518 RepID=A0A9P6J2X5_MORAP|nr:hypothetical protein BGZ70_008757 [Mortierella alpina]
MAILAFSTARNRAVLITVLLVMEFMAIVWLRESSPDEGRVRVPFHSDASGRDRHIAADSRALRHEEYHLQRMQHEQRQRGGYVYTGVGTGAEAALRSGGTVLQARAGTGPEPSVGAKSSSGSGHNEDEKERGHGEPLRPLQPQPQPQVQPSKLQQLQQPQSVGQLQPVEQLQQHLQPTEQGSIPLSSTRPGPTVAAPELPAAAETIARGDTSTTHQPDQEASSFIKITVSDTTQKAKAGSSKHRSSRAHEKNQRGGFKSTKERKLAQLIPALDENGVVIEDHFISPRDTDGDGIPDIYVLLRPTANSRYMMDVGLFDEDIVPPPPPPPPPPVLPVPLVLSATSVTPAIPSTVPPLENARFSGSPDAAEAIPIVEASVLAATTAPAMPSIESAAAPEPPASAALLPVALEAARPETETSIYAAAPLVAPAEAQ